jgi:conjugal transfer mating pair stabilization protein TraG
MADHSNAFEIFTYGGGQGLFDVFNAIATLAHPEHGLIVSFGWLALVLGAFWSVIHLFFAPKFEVIFMRFAFPACLIWMTCISVTTPVVIRDVLVQSDHKVDHVPYLFAAFCHVSSQLGYTLTKTLENVLHKPNESQYQKAGLIFGAQTALDFGKYRLNNANLEENLNGFCKKCVFYDLKLGKYSIDELKKTPDIWGFLAKNTSKSRLVEYCSHDKEAKFKAIKCELMTCQNAIAQMTEEFGKEKAYYQGIDFAKQLPLTFQALTKLQTHNKDLISQQLMMNVLTNNFPKRFAQERAKSFLNETYLMMGMSFQTGIISLRILLEAILYLSILVVIPLSFLPDGLNKLKNWALMYLWIQMWPPFFVIINFIYQTYAQADASQLFAGLSEAQQGLSLYTNVGATELYRDVLAKCGFAYTLVPILSFAFIKGGEMSFVSLAGSLVQPEQAAASSATHEMLSGNYSFGNVQYGQTQYANSNAFQNNSAPSVSDEFFLTNNGEHTQSYTASGRTVIRENLSDLANNLFVESSIGNQLHQSKQMAESQVETSQQSYTESVAENQRCFHDFTSHLANNDSYSTNLSSRAAQSAHEAASTILNDADQIASNYNVSSSDVVKAMLGTKLLGTGIEAGTEASNAELDSHLHSYTSSSDFQERLDKINEFSKSTSYQELKDEGVRLANSYSESLDKVDSSQDNLSNAYSTLNQISKTADHFDQNSFATREQITQEFVDFTKQKCQEENYPWTPAEILTGKNNLLRDDLMHQFSQSYLEKLKDYNPTNYISPQERYENSTIKKLDYNLNQAGFEKKYTIPQQQFSKQKNQLEKDEQELSLHVTDALSIKELSTNKGYNQAADNFDKEKSKYLFERATEHGFKKLPENLKNINFNFPNTLPLHPLDVDEEFNPFDYQ